VKKAIQLPFYPFLIVILPILRFYETNWKTLDPSDLGQAFLFYLLAAGVVLSLSRLIWRNWSRAAFVSAPLLFIFGLGNILGGTFCSALIGVALLFGGLFFYFKPAMNRINPAFNIAMVSFCLLSLFSGITNSRPGDSPTPKDLFHTELDLPEKTDDAPDIYYIVMDGLGQPGLLERNYDLPRYITVQPFERLGFRFTEFSNASYIQTSLSLSSTFNLAPIQDLLEIPNPRNRDRRVLGNLFKDSRAIRALRRTGYRIETISTGYPLTRMNRTDQTSRAPLTLNFASYILLEDGFLPLLQPLLGLGPSELSFATRRLQIEHFFDHLPDVARKNREEPVFVFAHVIAPHPPFVYNRLGKPRPSQKPFTYSDGSHWHERRQTDEPPYNDLYRDQASYLLGRLAETVAIILETSEKPPIIVIQGDHGPGGSLDWKNPGLSNLAERFGIFNAWYVPSSARKFLRPDIAAINTFPVLLNAALGADLVEQKEEYWYTGWQAPYTFLPIVKQENP
jgi:hypothetical protein